MGIIFATLRAFKDMEEVKTVDVARVRTILLRIAIRGTILIVVYVALFVLIYRLSAVDAMQATCADAGAAVCYPVYIFMSLYGTFFLFMFTDVVIAISARSITNPCLLRFGVFTNVMSVLLYLGGKGMYYEALLTRSLHQSWTIYLGSVLILVVTSYKSMCAIILRNLARRVEASGGFGFGLQHDAPMGSLDAPMIP